MKQPALLLLAASMMLFACASAPPAIPVLPTAEDVKILQPTDFILGQCKSLGLPNHTDLSTSGRVGHAFCGTENPDVLYEGTDDVKLVEAVYREAVQVALACANGTCATRGIGLVKKLGMLPVIGHNVTIRSIEFHNYASFTDVAVVLGKVGDNELRLYFRYEGGSLAVDEWGVTVP